MAAHWFAYSSRARSAGTESSARDSNLRRTICFALSRPKSVSRTADASAVRSCVSQFLWSFQFASKCVCAPRSPSAVHSLVRCLFECPRTLANGTAICCWPHSRGRTASERAEAAAAAAADPSERARRRTKQRRPLTGSVARCSTRCWLRNPISLCIFAPSAIVFARQRPRPWRLEAVDSKELAAPPSGTLGDGTSAQKSVCNIQLNRRLSPLASQSPGSTRR